MNAPRAKLLACIVTGTRRESEELLKSVVGAMGRVDLHAKQKGCRVLLIHGACPTGADKIASDYAKAHGWQQWSLPFVDGIGGIGGPARNRGLAGAAKGLVDFLRIGAFAFAFPDKQSRGTHDCAAALREAEFGVAVTNV